MPVFVQSITTPTLMGIYAIEREPPALVQSAGTATALLLGQFPWGPTHVDQATPFHPTNIGDLALTMAPPGMTRTGSGYLALLKKGWYDLRIVRAVGSAAAKATANLVNGGTTILVATLKYVGAAGNSVTWTIAAASDGDANHFDLTITITGASGTSSDILRNVDASGSSYTDPTTTGCILLGSMTRSNTGRPTDGTGSFSTGSDGTVNSARYLGTAGSGDYGLALAESDRDVRVVFADDPGDVDRAGVMAGLVAHATLMGDRMALIHGDSGLTLAQAQTDVATSGYSSWQAAYVDGWVRIRDDIDGTLRLVPGDSFLASVMTQISPSTSPACKAGFIREMLNGIVSLETSRGEAAGSNTLRGINTIIKEPNGGWSFEGGVTTIAPSTPAKKRITRTRIGHYIATSVVSSLRDFAGAPNVQVIQDDVIIAIDRFMSNLKKNVKLDPLKMPHVVDYGFGDRAAANSPQSIAEGNFIVPLDVTTSSGMDRIFLSMKFGETVTVTAS